MTIVSCSGLAGRDVAKHIGVVGCSAEGAADDVAIKTRDEEGCVRISPVPLKAGFPVVFLFLAGMIHVDLNDAR